MTDAHNNVEPLASDELRPLDLLVLHGAAAVARTGQAVTLPNVAAALDCPATILRCLYRIEPILSPHDAARSSRLSSE